MLAADGIWLINSWNSLVNCGIIITIERLDISSATHPGVFNIVDAFLAKNGANNIFEVGGTAAYTNVTIGAQVSSN